MIKRYSLAAIVALLGMAASAATATDVISSETITLTAVYEQQEVTLPSGATYLVTLKDEGNGPQFKAGGSAIVVTDAPGTVKSVSVTWGTKSNENVQVWGSADPFMSSNTAISGTDLGIVPFSASGTMSLAIEGDWAYIGLTSTANVGKACAFKSIAIEWEISDEPIVPDPCEGLVINEVSGDDGTTDGTEDWIEFVNSTSAAINLEGLQIVKIDEDGVPTVLYTYPAGTEIAAGEYKVCSKGVEFTAGLSNNKNMIIRLISPAGKAVSTFNKVAELTANGNHYPGGSYSRIPDITGDWASVANATKGQPNDATPVEARPAKFKRVNGVEELADGLEFILVNEMNSFVMSSSWNTTKDGNAYQLAVEADVANGEVTVDLNTAAICTLVGNSDGDNTWAIRFGATNNYFNDSRFLACKTFKNFDFKKADDPTKYTRCTIGINPAGDAEITYGAAGSIKFNLKTDGTSRFLNYDPTDKPEDHQPVHIYCLDKSAGVDAVAADIDTPAEYYNLQGIRVANPSAGIYIMRQGSRATKVLIK